MTVHRPRPDRCRFVAIGLAIAAISCASTGFHAPGAGDSAQTIRDADEAERIAMLRGDTKAQAHLWADEFIVTNTAGEVLSKRQVLDVFEAGIVPYSVFERVMEDVRIYGQVAVSIGREIVTPSGAPRDRRIPRRYTHVWVHRDGRWQLAARHAGIVEEPGRQRPGR